MSVLTFLIGLPLAVYTLAGLFALVDLADTSRALVTITSRLALTLLVLLLLGAQHWPWLLAAFACVALLHLGAFAAVRWGVYTGRWISNKVD